MPLTAKTTIRVGRRTFRKGESVEDVPPGQARHLISQGYAEVNIPEAKKSSPGDLDKLTVDQLKALADERKIDLGDATKKADIIAAIELATEAHN